MEPELTPQATVARLLSGRTSGWSPDAALAWLMTEGRQHTDTAAMLGSLGERLVQAGAPLWRMRIGMRTLHPQVRALSYVWVRGRGHLSSHVAHGIDESDAFAGSPMQFVYETGKSFRRRMDELQEGRDHGLLFELRDEGATDYLALPMRFAGEVGGIAVMGSDRPGGFGDDDLCKLTALCEFLSPVMEVALTRNIARSLLDTYVGRRTGGRVLRGRIRRGDAEVIDAAIWFSDLRDFTQLSETLSMDQMLATLNAYFEFVAAAVTARGGEILRFIGDAMLIIFPVGQGADAAAACEAAVDAAEDAFDSIATLNHRRRRNGEPAIRFGVGLHLGTVVYGNVGAPDRLDFTVMGAAVNRTARLESLTKTLGTSMLLSAEFAGRLTRPVTSLGEHAMKGVARPQEVFALA